MASRPHHMTRLLAAGGLLVAVVWGVRQRAIPRHGSPPVDQPLTASGKADGRIPRNATASTGASSPGPAQSRTGSDRPDTPVPPKSNFSETDSSRSPGEWQSAPESLAGSRPGQQGNISAPPHNKPMNPSAGAPLAGSARSTTIPHPSSEMDQAGEQPVRVPYASVEGGEIATIPGALAPGVDIPFIAGEDASASSATKDQPGSPLVRETAVAEVDRAADIFLAHLAGIPDDPANALRQQRWLEAQEASDARLRASLGGHAWMALHRDANRPNSGSFSNGTALPNTPHPASEEVQTPSPASPSRPNEPAR